MPARPSWRSLVEATAAAAAGAATEFVVFFGVLPDGAVRAGVVFAGRLARGPGSAVRRAGPARASAPVLGVLLVDVSDELDALAELRVDDEDGAAGAGWGWGAAVTLDPELVADGCGSGAGAEELDGYGSGLGDACPYAGAAQSAPIVSVRAAAGR
jgi:hypothetical protein